MKCAEPGCGGTVVDGYCDVCGTAPAPDAPAASQPVSTATAASASATPSARTASVRTSRTGPSTKGSGRGRLGAGIVEIPRIPKGDPVAAILTDPQVPESSRFCGNHECNKPVGRGRDGQPGRTEGFCTRVRHAIFVCSQAFSRRPVGGQYEVQGCIAHGGLGWIYLAIDRNVAQPLGGPQGPAELRRRRGDGRGRRRGPRPRRGRTPEHRPASTTSSSIRIQRGFPVGYIVMEYVGGTSLKQIRKAHNAPLPPDQAVAYIVEIAPALGYLHAQGLAYCDFKPDNVMQTDEQLKLIDLGAVVAMDDEDSAIYGTVGYQAPEIAGHGSHRRQRRVHRRADARRPRDGRPAGERPVRRPAARPRNGAGARQARIVVPARSCAPPTPIPTGASRPWRSWPTS